MDISLLCNIYNYSSYVINFTVSSGKITKSLIESNNLLSGYFSSSVLNLAFCFVVNRFVAF